MSPLASSGSPRCRLLRFQESSGTVADSVHLNRISSYREENPIHATPSAVQELAQFSFERVAFRRERAPFRVRFKRIDSFS